MRARSIRRALLITFGAAASLAAPSPARAQTPSANAIPPRTASAAPTSTPVESHDYTGLGIAAGAVVLGGGALVALRRKRSADVAPQAPAPRAPAPPRPGTERDTMR